MGNQLITGNDERIVSFFDTLERLLTGMESMAGNYRPVLNGERYLTDAEVSKRLKICRRTLQDYRTEGKIAWYRLGGKILYRESDIEKLLEENCIKPSENRFFPV